MPTLIASRLSSANLIKAILCGVNAQLSGAQLAQANLSRAKCRAQLEQGFRPETPRIDLSGVNLQGADRSYANFTGAILRRASLVGADWTGATLGAVIN